MIEDIENPTVEEDDELCPFLISAVGQRIPCDMNCAAFLIPEDTDEAGNPMPGYCMRLWGIQ